jgi:hypothetical protein
MSDVLRRHPRSFTPTLPCARIAPAILLVCGSLSACGIAEGESSCPGESQRGPCADAAGGPDAAGGFDAAGRADAAGEFDREWANWPLTRPADAFTATTDTVADALTGLVWQRAIPLQGDGATAVRWAEAGGVCAELQLGGHTDWRLPTRVELSSLLDLSVRPTVDPEAFADAPTGDFWSGTPVAGEADSRWTVNFTRGSILPTETGTALASVRCVRGGNPPPPGAPYAVEGMTVVDIRTQLTWQRQHSTGPLPWAEASGYCANLVLGGVPGWRLPSYVELMSLVDVRAGEGPTIDGDAFSSTSNSNFWTASKLSTAADRYYVAFQNGTGGHLSPTFQYYARCVR